MPLQQGPQLQLQWLRKSIEWWRHLAAPARQENAWRFAVATTSQKWFIIGTLSTNLISPLILRLLVLTAARVLSETWILKMSTTNKWCCLKRLSGPSGPLLKNTWSASESGITGMFPCNLHLNLSARLQANRKVQMSSAKSFRPMASRKGRANGKDMEQLSTSEPFCQTKCVKNRYLELRPQQPSSAWIVNHHLLLWSWRCCPASFPDSWTLPYYTRPPFASCGRLRWLRHLPTRCWHLRSATNKVFTSIHWTRPGLAWICASGHNPSQGGSRPWA